MSLTNTIVPVLAPMDNFFGLEYEFPITAAVQAMSLGVLSGLQVVPWTSPCGVNCSYTFSFRGPAYQCVELGPFSSASINLTEIEGDSTFYGSLSSPPSLNDSLLYYGVPDTGNETRPAGLLILYASLNQTLRCDLYNATYTTAVSYINNEQTIQNDIELHNSIVDGDQLYDTLLSGPGEEVLTNGTFWGQMNLVLLQYYASAQLVGYIYVYGHQVVEYTGAVYWPGLGQWTSGILVQSVITWGDLLTNVQDFLANFTLSLIGANVDTSQLVNVSSTLIVNTSVPATSTSYPVVYTYDAATLWEGYACALGFTTIGVIVGSCMLYGNGVVGQLTFAQVLVTTRNPTLDKISEGAGLGGKYITDRVWKLKVKYGLLEAGTEKMGFGTKDEIHSIGNGV